MPLAYIQELTGDRPDNSLPGGRPGHPSHPIVLPILPGIWPPPGQPNWPPSLVDPGYGVGSEHPSQGPIIIQGKPDQPIALPPGVYPPLPPAGLKDKYAILILIFGVGWRWLVVDPGEETAQPK